MTKTLEETEDAIFACAAVVLLVLGVAAMLTNAAFAPGVVAASSKFVESDAVDLKLVEAVVVVAAAADEVEMAYPVVVDAAAESAADLAAALGGRLAVASAIPIALLLLLSASASTVPLLPAAFSSASFSLLHACIPCASAVHEFSDFVPLSIRQLVP